MQTIVVMVSTSTKRCCNYFSQQNHRDDGENFISAPAHFAKHDKASSRLVGFRSNSFASVHFPCQTVRNTLSNSEPRTTHDASVAIVRQRGPTAARSPKTKRCCTTMMTTSERCDARATLTTEDINDQRSEANTWMIRLRQRYSVLQSRRIKLTFESAVLFFDGSDTVSAS